MDGVENRGVAPAHAMDVSPTTRPDPHPSASAAALALQRRMVLPMELGCADIASALARSDPEGRVTLHLDTAMQVRVAASFCRASFL